MRQQRVESEVCRKIQAARRRKAEKLAVILLRAGAETCDLSALTDQNWKLAAESAGFPGYLPGDETRDLAIAFLVGLIAARQDARSHVAATAARLASELNGRKAEL